MANGGIIFFQGCGKRGREDSPFFPVALKNRAIYKNAAYDVCRSRNADTHFQRWDEIKQNLVVNWVDVVDESEKTGLGLFSDHTTAYSHGPDHPLALVMAWGWEGGFWWGKCPLKGVQQASYAVIPHGGLWDEATDVEYTFYGLGVLALT